ncbi:hypothetical protein [Chloroflexus sp.]|uniref:hypothetical protein n=1 Tax=Chloroflexus sp. TaxID=1904827 RepID=UPI00298F1CB7|nr:hypothetical protein [Chloroflexus sp.]MDW8403653.1 hypothetical protein [Chloroflexus sp.]
MLNKQKSITFKGTMLHHIMATIEDHLPVSLVSGGREGCPLLILVSYSLLPTILMTSFGTNATKINIMGSEKLMVTKIVV